MPDTSRNFTCMTNEEIMSELKKADELHLAIKRLKNQLKLYSLYPGFILWTKDKRELRREKVIEYLRKKLVALTKELIG